MLLNFTPNVFEEVHFCTDKIISGALNSSVFYHCVLFRHLSILECLFYWTMNVIVYFCDLLNSVYNKLNPNNG